MSSPKRNAQTTPAKKSTAQKPKKTAARKSPAKAAKSSVAKSAKPVKTSTKSSSKSVVKKSAKKAAKKVAPKIAKTAPKKTVKKAAKKTIKTTAQKVAKKVAKIISKIVAEKKTGVKKADAKKSTTKKKAAAKTGAAKKTTKASGQSLSQTARTVATRLVKKASRLGKKSPSPASAVVNPAPITKSIAKSTAKPRRPKKFAETPVERDFGFPADTPELPEAYGEDRLVLMTKDPEYLFAYWEITPDKQAEGERVKRVGEEYREAMRLNWATHDIFERNFAVVPVSLKDRKMYLRVPFSGLAYQIEIGWLSESGHFISLLMSNPSDAPESWNATRRRLKKEATKNTVLEHILNLGAPQGSSEAPPKSTRSTPTSPSPIQWDFPGPSSLTSSSTANTAANKKFSPKPSRRNRNT